MAKKYIDADALMVELEREVDLADDWKTAHEIANVVKYFPTADVRENVRGKWMHDKDDALVSGYCSCCGWTTIYTESEIAYMQFCPSCGADMRGGNE